MECGLLTSYSYDKSLLSYDALIKIFKNDKNS